MSEFAISKIETGQLNALVKNLMLQMGISDPQEAVRKINSGEWIVSKRARFWQEKDGVIYFSVTSDGTTGPEWIERLGKKGFQIEDYAKILLRSDDFKPTSGVTYIITVLKGEMFFVNDRITKNICAEADKKGFTKPNAEVACLIRENFSDKEIKAMGLWWVVVMHEPIKDSVGDSGLLFTGRHGVGRWLFAHHCGGSYKWGRGDGFAFVVSQVPLEIHKID